MIRKLFAGLSAIVPMAVTGTLLAYAMPVAPNVSIIPPPTAELVATYPDAAKGKNVQGFVLLLCTVARANSVNCVSGQWSPNGYGFDSAALQIAAKLKVKSNDKQTYEGSRFNLQIRFPASPQNDNTTLLIPTIGSVQPGLEMPPKPAAMINPITVIPPASDDVAEAFPDAARGANIAGYVLLTCTVQDGGTLACTMVNETPPGYNFGEAALKLSTKLRVRSNDQATHVGYRINVPIRFPPNSLADSAPQ